MSGSVWLPQGARPDSLPAIPRQPRGAVPSWAGPDPIDELAIRIEDLVTHAVHPDEVAALLESDGLSDDQIRERYGVKNSFALAEELYERVPRPAARPSPFPADVWHAGLANCLLRGLIFALPGFAYVLGAPWLASPPGPLGLPAGTVPLLTGALFGWAWNQGLSHRAYTWLGLGDREAARRSLLLGAPTGAALGTLLAWTATGHANPESWLFTAGQCAYLGASTALLVLGRERALLAALLPMAAGAGAVTVWPVPEWTRLTLLLGSLAAVVGLGACEAGLTPGKLRAVRLKAVTEKARQLKALAGKASRLKGVVERLKSPAGKASRPRAAGAGPNPRKQSPSEPLATPTPPLSASLPYALFGLGSGTLVLCLALTDALDGEAASLAAPSAIALTLSMGPAEWLLHRFRSGGTAGLHVTRTARAFRRTAARVVALCLGGYLLILLTLALAADHLPATPTDTHFAALLLLGVVLWTGLLLQSLGAVGAAAAVCCTAALAQVAATEADLPTLPTALTVYGTAAAVQVALACALSGRATAHR